jgi:GT2 family glycosyltransferase
LVEQGQRPEVGVVGARLFYPDGTLQHAGIVVGTGVIGWHIFMGLPPSGSAYLGWDRAVRPYSAVTGACFLTRRDVFDALGGFDETLEVAFNDVDYCLRARDLGYEVLYTPHAVLIHNEAMSRGLAGYRADGRRFLAKWDRSRLREDPFFNRNLSRFAAWCPLRQPGEDQLWEAYVDDLAGSVT